MADGQQSKAIAWQLGLSIRTVEMHRSNLLAKFEAANATQAVATARALDLLPAAVAVAA
jgi:two-component system response regulator FixJ